MRINKLNYEAYAVDYLDGLLPSDLTQEMEDFLLLHPEIKEELIQLTAMVVVPDRDVVFKNKSDLKQPITSTGNPQRKTLILWIGLAAAVLFGGMLFFKSMMPGKIHPDTIPIVEEKKDQNPVVDLPVVNAESPEIKQELDLPEDPKTNLKVLKPEEIPSVGKSIVAKQKPVYPITTTKTNKKPVVEITIPEKLVKKDEPAIYPEREKPLLEKSALAADKIRGPETEVANQPESLPEPEPKQQMTPIPESIQDEAVAEALEPDEPSLEPPGNLDEDLAAVANQPAESEENAANSNKNKRKRVFFSRIKEKFSKSNIANALLPEAYSTGSEE